MTTPPTDPAKRHALAKDVEPGHIYSTDGGGTWTTATGYSRDETPVLVRRHKPSPALAQSEVLDEDEEALHGLLGDNEHRGPWRVVVRFSFEEFGGVVVEDDKGAAYCWNDYVINNWVEFYPTTAQALGRLALGCDASTRHGFFMDGAEGFAVTVQDFFDKEAQ